MPIRTTPTLAGNSDPSWLGSAHGTDATQSITLDLSKFDKETYWPKGRIRSGTPLGVITASGLYGPYTAEPEAGDEDGTETLVGFLYADVVVLDGDETAPAAIFLHGQVKPANLPHPLPDTAYADVAGQIIFRGE